MGTLACALIGCGRIAANHLKAMAQPGFRLVAVCDVDPAQADALFVRAGVPAVPCYTDYRTMLAAHPELDLVAIATPSGTHGSIAPPA